MHKSDPHYSAIRVHATRFLWLTSTCIAEPMLFGRMHASKTPDPHVHCRSLHMLRAMPACALQAVRDGEKEVSSIIELRRQQECDIRLTWAYPDADRDVTARPAAGGETVQEGLAQDYLASFLPTRLADSPSAVMTANEASEAKNKCMQVRMCHRR